jgi:putative flippase GtrA
MPRKDLTCGFIIGGAVGLLIQPILANNISPAHLTPVIRIGIFFFFLVLAPLGLWIAKLISRWMPALYQFAQFGAVGTLNSFIDLGVLNIETHFNGTALISNTLFATFKAVSFLFATTNSFVWNKYWTFNAKEKTNAKEVSTFYLVALVGWGLNVVAATLVKAYGPATTVWITVAAPIGGIIASFLWDFLGYKYLVFKK